MKYTEFLQTKRKTFLESGFEIDESKLNINLFDFQKHIVRTALRKGKYAIFADCGLGKTLMQLEWAYQVVKFTNKPVLVLAPLAVTGQTINEGLKFGIEVIKWSPDFNTMNELAGIYITNYEQLDTITIIDDFTGVVLDESSILKNFEGKTKNEVIDLFQFTSYKLACTATPSPNDPMELGNHSEFLNVMSRNEVLAMYFIHDGGDTSKWRLKGHCEQKFWDWISEWAVMLSKPSDIGFDATGYDLPPLNLIEKQVKTANRENGQLFNDVAISATNFNQELRLTKVDRLTEVVGLVNNSKEQFIIWIKQNEEGEYLKKLIPDAIEVKGSDSPEFKEKHLIGFGNGEFRVLITKTKIAQFGLNYQNCHNQVFASLDFSFEGLYQAIRRSYRFGQKSQVNIYMVTTDTMRNVIESINKKQKQFELMQKSMTEAVNKNLQAVVKTKHEREFKEYKTENCTFQLGDCVRLIDKIESESVGFSMFSPPFAELYTYSDELEDMGNSKDYKEFLKAFVYLVKGLNRIMIPGRIVAVHCMYLPIMKGKEGYIGFRNFPGMIEKAFLRNGFVLNGPPITIWKDPVVEMQRTKAIGLLNKQKDKDATLSRTGNPDFVLVFRKLGDNPYPVTHSTTDTSHPNYLPVDLWQKYASPVWYDIDYGNTLNSREARHDKDEKHICPLQLETIERATHLWSNPGDLCYTPFGGIASEPYQWLKMGRKAIGHELKESYFNVGIKNIKNVELKKTQATLEFILTPKRITNMENKNFEWIKVTDRLPERIPNVRYSQVKCLVVFK